MPDIGEGETRFILKGIQNNFRVDGRNNFEYREIFIETGNLKNCNGSSHIKLGDTEIMVGIKAEICSPSADLPNEGFIEFYAQSPSHDLFITASKENDDIGEDIEILFENIFKTSFDKSTLIILKNEFCWKLFVEILVVSACGNIYDAISFAVKLALFNTKIPVVVVRKDEDTGKNFVELSNKFDDDEISLDIKNCPIIVTFAKIGSHHIVDACLEEESCSIASLLTAIDSKGKIQYSKKIGLGSLNPFSIQEMIKCASEVGIQMNKLLMKTIEYAKKH